MKKRILFVLALLLCLTAAVSAAPRRVVDDAGLLTAAEAQSLEALADSVSSRHEMDVVVVTVDSLGGKSPMEYADDYYDYNGYGPDGVLLLVSMNEREWWISTTGKCINIIDSYEIDNISETFLPDLSDGAYYNAFRAFMEECDSTIEADGKWNVGMLLICIAIGAVIGLVVVLVMKSQLKSVRPQSGAGNYLCSGSLHMDVSRDVFLYQNVTRRAKPEPSSSGGTHIGSSGTSHGGGGGRF